jgi:hypothetical protein
MYFDHTVKAYQFLNSWIHDIEDNLTIPFRQDLIILPCHNQEVIPHLYLAYNGHHYQIQVWTSIGSKTIKQPPDFLSNNQQDYKWPNILLQTF